MISTLSAIGISIAFCLIGGIIGFCLCAWALRFSLIELTKREKELDSQEKRIDIISENAKNDIEFTLSKMEDSRKAFYTVSVICLPILKTLLENNKETTNLDICVKHVENFIMKNESYYKKLC